ncbi:MAG: type 4a pilus biogenesis protein PilO [Planctomycetes bacterium]|nr:type 4a pilus biogenesis protein PilO [Planctomycetota bacterium]
MKLRPTDALTLGVILVGAVAWGVLGVRPIAERIASLERERDATRLSIARGDDFVRGLDDLQTYLTEFEQALADLDRLVPERVDATARLNEINAVAMRCGLRPSMVRPDQPQPRGAIIAHPITVRVSGDYEHLLRFIFDVESLPRHTRVTRLDVEAEPLGAGSVLAQLELTAYSIDSAAGGGS